MGTGPAPGQNQSGRPLMPEKQGCILSLGALSSVRLQLPLMKNTIYIYKKDTVCPSNWQDLASSTGSAGGWRLSSGTTTLFLLPLLLGAFRGNIRILSRAFHITAHQGA